MTRPQLFVTLGTQRYRVERPFGDLAGLAGVVSDVAVAEDGRVLVLLRLDSQVQEGPAVVVLSPAGAVLASWGEAVADGHLFGLHPDGRVFVVDRDAHEVVIFSPEGERLGGLGKRGRPGEPFNAPSDIAFAADGACYVADGYGNSLIHRFGPDGRLEQSWGGPGRRAAEFSTPHGICVLADGRVVVADRENHRVQIFTAQGEHRGDVFDLHKPMAVHAMPDGGFLVSDQVPRLSRYSAAGKLVGRCRPVLNGAHGLWLGADGCIWMAELNPSRVSRLVPV